MMIAYWMHDSVKPQVISTRLSANVPHPSPEIKLAGASRRVMPRSATVRSRTA
jgi:hypothetical protein